MRGAKIRTSTNEVRISERSCEALDGTHVEATEQLGVAVVGKVGALERSHILATSALM